MAENQKQNGIHSHTPIEKILGSNPARACWLRSRAEVLNLAVPKPMSSTKKPTGYTIQVIH